MKLEEAIQTQIDDIMDSFDFGRVAEVMKALDWRWSSTGNQPPNEYELRSYARSLLKSNAKCGGWSSCGGFRATRQDGVDNGKPWVRLILAFELESWSEDGVTYEQ